MPKSLVECIPNFSAARQAEVVEAIARSICEVPGIALLDRHSDLDHNRTVLTFVGPPAEVEEAAFRGIAKAAELIDLDQHQGEHPRIGAADVVPFVPISGMSMQECVEMARRLGRRVGDELGIPVYLYEQAATRPERQNLENIRRGQYETLKEEIATHPERAPDFGPARVGPAGATVIGARYPLIAYNVYLTTEDVSIARKVARAVRFSSGGLRYVKALGMLVEGRAQVSMNLTNASETPLARVVEMVRREAERYGVGIHHSELVGLIPQDALQDAAAWYLQLDGFSSEQVLERKIFDKYYAPLESTLSTAAFMPGSDFLDALAAGTPAPGGGSAAAYAGAMAAALAAMVARLTIGKKKYASVEAGMQALLAQAEDLRRELTQMVQRDAAAFEAVMEAYRLPQGTPEEQQERLRAVQEATLKASQEPLNAGRAILQVMELLSQAVQLGNLNAISDAAVGFSLARAALRGVAMNVRLNLHSLPDSQKSQEMIAELCSLEARAEKFDREVGAAFQERSGLALKRGDSTLAA